MHPIQPQWKHKNHEKCQNKHNLSKSSPGRHDTPLLKHSQWDMKSCGG